MNQEAYRHPQAGDIWHSSEQVTQLGQISKPVLEQFEVRTTRLPDWNNYYIFPIYKKYFINTQSDADDMARVEGPGSVSDIEIPCIIDLLVDVIGVGKTSRDIVYIPTAQPERHMINMLAFDTTAPMTVITSHPFEALMIVNHGDPAMLADINIISTIHGYITPANDLWLTNYIRGDSRNVLLVNIKQPASQNKLIFKEIMNVREITGLELNPLDGAVNCNLDALYAGLAELKGGQ